MNTDLLLVLLLPRPSLVIPSRDWRGICCLPLLADSRFPSASLRAGSLTLSPRLTRGCERVGMNKAFGIFGPSYTCSDETLSLRYYQIRMQRPAGVTAVATLFFLSAGYLFLLGVIMLVRAGTVSMRLGSPLLHGLELSGPYMFLLAAAGGAGIGFGLLRLNNWARRVAVIVGMLGIVMLIPVVSAAVALHGAFFWGGLGIVVRAAVVWYLWQGWVVEKFQRG